MAMSDWVGGAFGEVSWVSSTPGLASDMWMCMPIYAKTVKSSDTTYEIEKNEKDKTSLNIAIVLGSLNRMFMDGSIRIDIKFPHENIPKCPVLKGIQTTP